jgi:NAD(P)-dependent dehydrogenase (short-subunit alcohol dehydrogenase family)
VKNTVLGGVVITGASTGIGEACAFHLDALGFRVFAGVRNPADGERLTRAASDRLVPVHLDVTDAVSVKAAAETVAHALGDAPLSGLVNNAGIAVASPLEFVPLDALRRQLEVNVIGQVAVTQVFLPSLRSSRGRIVNMGSVSGRFASPFMGPYSASKFALEALSDSLRLELRPWGIHVSILEPGVIATPIWRKSLLAADELAMGMPEEAHTLYGRAIEAIRKRVESIGGIPAERVARVVAHALTARRPRPRYVVGRDARVAVGLSYLPTRMRDWLVAKRL